MSYNVDVFKEKTPRDNETFCENDTSSLGGLILQKFLYNSLLLNAIKLKSKSSKKKTVACFARANSIAS